MGRENLGPIKKFDGTLYLFDEALKNNTIDYDDGKSINDLTSCPLDGAYLSLSKIDSLAILFHSPEGCCTSLWFLWGGAFSLKSQVDGGENKGAITLTSGMSERDIIYGGIDNLKKAIEDVKRLYDPEYTVILTSCCSNIIGDDINEAVRYGRDNLGMNIAGLDTAGFKTWYWPNGYDLAHRFLVDNVMGDIVEKDKNKKLVNLIGYGNASALDEKELIRLLNLCGIEVQLPLKVPYTSIEKIKEAPKANLNVMMCKAYGWAFCEAMKQKYDIDYLKTTQQLSSYYSEKFLLEIGAYFNCLACVKEVIQNEKEKIEREVNQYREYFRGKRVAISAGHDKAFSLMALMKEIDLEICYLGLLTYDNLVKEKVSDIKEYLGYDFKLVVNPQTYEEVEILSELTPDVYIAPAGLTARTNVMGIPSVNIHFNDFVGNYFGFSGVLTMANLIKSTMETKKPFYVTETSILDYNGRCLKYESENHREGMKGCH